MSVVLYDKKAAREEMIGKTIVRQYKKASGEMVNKPIKITGNGSPVVYDKPLGEINTPAALYDFIDKTIVDQTRGMLEEPVLYKPIYRTVNDPTLTRYLRVQEWVGVRMAFTQVHPGESVTLADFKDPSETMAEIVTYGTGWGISRDWTAYNELYRISQMNQMLGIAYNAKLNNIYLGPIIGHTYAAGSKTVAVVDANNALTYSEKVRETVRNAVAACLKRRHAVTNEPLKPTIGICNSYTAFYLNEILNKTLTVKGTEYAPINLTLIPYDGRTLTVGGNTITYAAPADNKLYLVEPQKGFVEFIKEDLTALTQEGDIYQLLSQKYVWEFMRGLIADVTNYCHEVTLPNAIA